MNRLFIKQAEIKSWNDLFQIDDKHAQKSEVRKVLPANNRPAMK
jgi:hypothetical protein